MDTIFIKHLFLVWCGAYTDFYLIENFSGKDCTYVCFVQLWIMRYNWMNSWKINFLSASLRLIKFRFML